MSDAQLAKMVRFARFLNVSVQVGRLPGMYQVTYRNGTIHLICPTLKGFIQSHPRNLNNNLARDLAHELGHYLIAPKTRRNRKDYGIPISHRRGEKSNHYWDLDDAKADLVGHELLREFGFGSRITIGKDPISSLRSGSTVEIYKEAHAWWKSSEGSTKIHEIMRGFKSFSSPSVL